MTKPRWSRQELTEECAPQCPHCREPVMDTASITLESLAANWPLTGTIPVDAEGYAASNIRLPHVACPECHKMSAVAFTGHEIRLIAQRTERDEAMLGRKIWS